MRTVLTISFTCLLTFVALAQAPHQFNYQAVARDAQEQVIIGHIEARFSLHADSEHGVIHYIEQHATETNAQGIFNLIIGNGQAVQGQFSDVDWASHQYWIRVEIKAPGEDEFGDMGTSQLLSVPYALHAATSDLKLLEGAGIEIVNQTIHNTGDLSETNELQTLNLVGNQLSLSNGGGTVTLPEATSDTWVVSGNTISNSPNNSRVAIGATQSADAKLYVKSTSSDYAVKFDQTGDGPALMSQSQDGVAGTFFSNDGTAGVFSSENGHALITDQGHVGIGITNPAYPLHIHGTTKMDGEDSFALVVGEGNVGMGGTLQSTKLAVFGKEQDGLFVSSEDGTAFRAVSEGPYAAGHFTGHEGVAGSFTSVGNYCIYAHQGYYGSASASQGILLQNGGEHWKMFIDINKDYNFAFNDVLKAWIYDTDGSYHNSSDRSLKKNIKTKTNVLPGLLQLQAYTYHMKSAPDDSQQSLGFMADEVEAVFPELVVEKEGHKSLCYDHFAVLSVEAIKEQQVQIEALMGEVERLKAMMNELKVAVSSSTGQ